MPLTYHFVDSFNKTIGRNSCRAVPSMLKEHTWWFCTGNRGREFQASDSCLLSDGALPAMRHFVVLTSVCSGLNLHLLPFVQSETNLLPLEPGRNILLSVWLALMGRFLPTPDCGSKVCRLGVHPNLDIPQTTVLENSSVYFSQSFVILHSLHYRFWQPLLQCKIVQTRIYYAVILLTNRSL